MHISPTTSCFSSREEGIFHRLFLKVGAQLPAPCSSLSIQFSRLSLPKMWLCWALLRLENCPSLWAPIGNLAQPSTCSGLACNCQYDLQTLMGGKLHLTSLQQSFTGPPLNFGPLILTFTNATLTSWPEWSWGAPTITLLHLQNRAVWLQWSSPHVTMFHIRHTEFMYIMSTTLFWELSMVCLQIRRDLKSVYVLKLKDKKKSENQFQRHLEDDITMLSSHGLKPLRSAMLLGFHPKAVRGWEVCFSIQNSEVLCRKSLNNQNTLLSHIAKFSKFPETYRMEKKKVCCWCWGREWQESKAALSIYLYQINGQKVKSKTIHSQGLFQDPFFYHY